MCRSKSTDQSPVKTASSSMYHAREKLEEASHWTKEPLVLPAVVLNSARRP